MGTKYALGSGLAQRKPQEMFKWQNSLSQGLDKSKLKTLSPASSHLRFPKAQPSCLGSWQPPGVISYLMSAEAILPPPGIHGWKMFPSSSHHYPVLMC